jgi:hypothetical protein
MFFTIVGFIFCVSVIGFALWNMIRELYNLVVYQICRPIDTDDFLDISGLLIIIVVLCAMMVTIFAFAPWEISWVVDLKIK